MTQLAEMFKLQDAFNQVVNPNWKDAGYAFHQGVYVEAAEATEHMTYKWWKGGQKPDLKQTWIEMVDIWHFGLSMRLYEYPQPCQLEGFHKHIRRVIHAATADVPYFDTASFKLACEAIGMTEDDLYKLYLMKNVLNKFRQDNGYKTGTYIKDWGGEYPEDNLFLEHLFEIRVDWTFDSLYNALQVKYKEVQSKTIEG